MFDNLMNSQMGYLLMLVGIVGTISGMAAGILAGWLIYAVNECIKSHWRRRK